MIYSEKHPLAGQNIGRRGSTREYQDLHSVILKIIKAWFSEHEDANMTYIDSFHEDPW